MVSHLYNISFIFLTSPFMVDFIVYIRVIRVIRSSYHPLFSFVIMSFCLQKNICLHLSLCHSVSKKTSVFICHYVILSSRIPLSSSVPLLFCLKNLLCLYPSLCYSVSKTSSVFICPYVTLSSIYSVCIVLKSLDNDVYKGLG